MSPAAPPHSAPKADFSGSSSSSTFSGSSGRAGRSDRADRAGRRDRAAPALRAGAVARLLGMPVATLRVWERRYGLATAPASPGGHRQYSEADLQRLRALRRLTQAGLAIGSLAGLDQAALQRLLDQLPAAPTAPGGPASPARLVLWGEQAAQRLAPVLAGLAWQQAGRDLRVDEPPGAPVADGVREPLVWLAVLPVLDADTARALRAALAQAAPARWGLLYGFAPQAELRDLRALGGLLLREPADGPALAAWVGQLLAPWPEPALPVGRRTPAPADGAEPADPPHGGAPRCAEVPGREGRFTEEDLLAIAANPSATACECARHAAETALQLTRFEHYTRQCIAQHPADAARHARLAGRLAQARAWVEAGLQDILAEVPAGRSPRA